MLSLWVPRVFKNWNPGDFPCGLGVKDLPSNAGNAGSVPGLGRKTPQAVGQLRPCATPTEPTCSGARRAQETHLLRQKPRRPPL